MPLIKTIQYTDDDVIYLYRRKGQRQFITCDRPRFLEFLSHDRFEVMVAYSSNSIPTLVKAEPATRDMADAPLDGTRVMIRHPTWHYCRNAGWVESQTKWSDCFFDKGKWRLWAGRQDIRVIGGYEIKPICWAPLPTSEPGTLNDLWEDV